MSSANKLTAQSPVIVAMDMADIDAVNNLADQLDPRLCRLKVGKELFTRFGPAVVEHLMGKGYEIFLDLKFHDIPNTVAAAVKAAADMSIWMVNVHASGGERMLTAAREAAHSVQQPPLLIAVTVLTSLSQEDTHPLGWQGAPEEMVMRLARLTHESGLDGVVCSAQEAEQLRDAEGEDFLLVTPGIRPAEAVLGDQQRVMTPEQAVKAGSDYLVIGRPITQSDNPREALEHILSQLANAE